MVLVIEGTESTGSVADTWTADDNRPSSPGRQKNRMNPDDSGEQPGLNQPPRRPREESGGPRSNSPGGMGSFPHSPPMPPHFGQNPAAPFQHPPHPMMLVPPGGHTGFDHVLDSPVIKKVLELMQENMELKAHMEIQSVQVESKMHVMKLELKVDHLRRQLDQAGAELKEATISKERLEKRISELEHRSRILEERAKAIGERAARSIRPESMKRIESEWRRQFEEHSARGDRSHPPAEAAYGREEPESADGVLDDDEKGEGEEEDDEEEEDEEEEEDDK